MNLHLKVKRKERCGKMKNKYFVEAYVAPSWQRLEMLYANVFNNLDDLMINSKKHITDLNAGDITKWEFRIFKITSLNTDGLKTKAIAEFRSFGWEEETEEMEGGEIYKPNGGFFDDCKPTEEEIILKHWDEIKNIKFRN